MNHLQDPGFKIGGGEREGAGGKRGRVRCLREPPLGSGSASWVPRGGNSAGRALTPLVKVNFERGPLALLSARSSGLAAGAAGSPPEPRRLLRLLPGAGAGAGTTCSARARARARAARRALKRCPRSRGCAQLLSLLPVVAPLLPAKALHALRGEEPPEARSGPLRGGRVAPECRKVDTKHQTS